METYKRTPYTAMKYIFISLLSLVSLTAAAQNDTLPVHRKFDRKLFPWQYDTLRVWVSFGDPRIVRFVGEDQHGSHISMGVGDSSFHIQGDTMEVIKMLWYDLDKALNREVELLRSVHKAVQFTNTVYDHLKTSKQWYAFEKAIHQLGYRTYIRTPKKKKP